MDKDKLKHEIMALDFALADLKLYLNTHPYCEKGLRLYRKAVDEAKMLRKEYEENYGPITATSTPNKLPWQWSRNPWTWEKERS